MDHAPQSDPSGAGAARAPEPGIPSADIPTGDAFAGLPAELTERFEIQTCLGHGGMGIVYKAIDRNTHETVALKMIRGRFADDPRSEQRFKNELLLSHKVTHRNVCRIHDYGRAGNVAYIKMEFLPGLNLRTLLLRRKSLPVEDTLRVALDMCAALGEAHRVGVLHSDIKPENIMIADNGDTKLMDFGIARSADADPALTITGTPSYMSPEQANGLHLDARSDLYSLGLVLYEALAGVPAFSAETPKEVMYKQVFAAPRALRELRPDVPAHLESTISRCLEKDPAARFASAEELASALAPAAAPAVSARKSWMGTVVATLAIALAIAAGLWYRHPGPPLPGRKNLVVLPFETVGGSPEDRFTSDGLTETVTAALARVAALNVTSSGQVRSLEKRTIDAARTELGASIVLEANLHHIGNQVRIILKLVDARTYQQLRTETFDESWSDPFTLENKVVDRLLAMLQEPGRVEKVAQRVPQPTAYGFFLSGKGYLQDSSRPENTTAAIDLFQKALAVDPKYAPAQAGLGEAYLQRYRENHDATWIEQGLVSCKKAMELDPRGAEPLICDGRILVATGKQEQAVGVLRRATEIDATSPDAAIELAQALALSGEPADAEKEYRRALTLRPEDWNGYNELGKFFFRQGKLADAENMFAQVTKLAPDSARGFANLGAVLRQEGSHEKAIQASETSLRLHPTFATLSNLGAAYSSLRRWDQAADVYKKALTLREKEPIVLGNYGEALFWKGSRDDARDAFQQAITFGSAQQSVNSRDPNLLRNLAWIYARLGNRKSALDCLSRAFALKPDDADIHFAAAVVYAQFNEPKEMFGELKKSIERGVRPSKLTETPDFDKWRTDPRMLPLLPSR